MLLELLAGAAYFEYEVLGITCRCLKFGELTRPDQPNFKKKSISNFYESLHSRAEGYCPKQSG